MRSSKPEMDLCGWGRTRDSIDSTEGILLRSTFEDRSQPRRGSCFPLLRGRTAIYGLGQVPDSRASQAERWITSTNRYRDRPSIILARASATRSRTFVSVATARCGWEPTRVYIGSVTIDLRT